jgi:hypothetical protein
MFDNVYATLPPLLEAQREQFLAQMRREAAEGAQHG